VNVWLLWPQLAVHACFSIGAGLLTGMAELTRPVVPQPEWLSDEALAKFTAWDYNENALPREQP
jgi:hypothetical protein